MPQPKIPIVIATLNAKPTQNGSWSSIGWVSA